MSVEKIGDIQSNIFPMEGSIDFSFDLPIPIMQSKAKPTTILNVIPVNNRFLILKNYFIDFIKNFEIGEFESWKIKVKHKNDYYDDYSLFVLSFPLQKEIIDFEKSKFYKGKFTDQSFLGEDIIIKDYENYLTVQNKFQNSDDDFLKFKLLSLDFSKIEVDMFRIWNFPFGGYYVSERLKNSIEEKRFTGFAFQEIEEMDKRIKVIY
ncbi:hypothetical protein [Flavobacterium sp.]|uniref:hypothetical protein n=1 Tax=Flavobacterium sp. TaxID=239 RepID=UPI0025B8FE9B|nr:hypothetical protein [Flavobacterium sp.]